MVDIQYTAAEIRRGKEKKKERRQKKPQGKNIMVKRPHHRRTLTVYSLAFARWRQCASFLIHASLDPPESPIKTASRSVQSLLHSSPQSVPILYNVPLSRSPPSKLPIPMGIWIPIYHMVLTEPTRVLNPSGISIR